MVLGGVVDSFIKQKGDVFNTILLKLSKHKDLESLYAQPDLQHIVLTFDRGYFYLRYVEQITKAMADTLGTAKKDPNLPVTYGDSKIYNNQTHVPEKGMRYAAWWVTKLQSGKNLYLCWDRDGLGKVVMLQTTYELFGPGKWVFEFQTPDGLPSPPVDMNTHPTLGHFTPHVFGNTATLLTWDQRGIAWFLCRYGMISILLYFMF